MHHRLRLPDLDSHKVINMQNKLSKLIRAWEAAKHVLPKYSSKFSRKDFTQHQLIAIAALKQRTAEKMECTKICSKRQTKKSYRNHKFCSEKSFWRCSLQQEHLDEEKGAKTKVFCIQCLPYDGA